MIVTWPLLCKISIGNGPDIIPGMPSGRHATTRSAIGCPFAFASRSACNLACHAFRYCGFSGGCGWAGIEASLARSHEPVMSGTAAEDCCALALTCANPAAPAIIAISQYLRGTRLQAHFESMATLLHINPVLGFV